MREYSNKISLLLNSRGVYSLDPSIGCTSGTRISLKGCYEDCYAARISKIYGYAFNKTVFRDFEDKKHIEYIKRKIKKLNISFLRMGTMGDPSENWSHTLRICMAIQKENQYKFFKEKNTEIVIVTRHWNVLSEEQLYLLKDLNICINTSISALDSQEDFTKALTQYERLKPFCKSVLRIISCDFNQKNEIGQKLKNIQDEIFKNFQVLDTVFRPSKSNQLIKDEIINVSEFSFLGKKSLQSKYNKRTYTGKCSTCSELCGVGKLKEKA